MEEHRSDLPSCLNQATLTSHQKPQAKYTKHSTEGQCTPGIGKNEMIPKVSQAYCLERVARLHVERVNLVGAK
jgi:hypothetical protein